jgi:osmotically-inducible protein OsmY
MKPIMSTERAASLVAAIALMFSSASCADRNADTADTAAGTVGATAGAAAATPATTPGAPGPGTAAETNDDRIEVALSNDANLRGFGLDVDERSGRIILRGAVRTEQQKAEAGQVALRIVPGATIDNRIRVEAAARMGTTAPTDADDAEEKVENALEADAVLGPFDLEVDEDDGRIIISGNVRTAAQKAQAEQIARNIAGTITIVNRVAVRP